MDPAGVRETYSAQIEHFAERGGDARHRPIVKLSERALDETAIIDRAQLIDEQVGITPQRRLRGHADAQRFGGVDEISG